MRNLLSTCLCLPLCLLLFALPARGAGDGGFSALQEESAQTEPRPAPEESADDPAAPTADPTESPIDPTESPIDPTEETDDPEEATAREEEAPQIKQPRFPDLADHWAEAVLTRALEDGLLTGFADGTLRPDDPVNRAEAMTVLVRLLHAEKTADPAALGLDTAEWYAEAAAKGAYLGLMDWKDLPLQSLDRISGFRMLNRAFALCNSAETPALSAFTDVAFCSRAEQRELGYLLAAGYLEGHGGLLEPYAPLTRAEFVTILYRILDGGRVFSGEAALEGTYEAPLFLDCGTDALTLTNVTAPALTLLSQSLTAVDFAGESRIGRLTLAGGGGEGFHFSTNSTSFVDTLVIGGHRGPVTVDSPVNTLLLTGEGQTVTLNAPVETLILLGNGSAVAVNRAVSAAEIYGCDLRLSGSGSIGAVTSYGGSLELSDEGLVAAFVDETDPGIEGIALSASAPETLPAGVPLTYTVTVTNPVERTVTLLWRMDGETVHQERVTVGPAGNSFAHTFPVTYEKDMALWHEVEMILHYEDMDGVIKTASKADWVKLENYPESHYFDYAAQVVSGYQGDYTTAWAEKHDYSAETKTAWINSRGHGSQTGYLIWINLSHQRVNVFTGSRGDWTLAQSFLCGTGRPARSTPVGNYTVTARKEAGWTTRSYHVSPVVNFTNATYKEMAFHSRKYDSPKKNYLVDASIGFPVSDGCVRMYDEDVRWIFDTVPNGTAVVVY